MIKEMYQEYEHKMKKTVEVVISDFGGVRAGRANASVLDKISVEYYGTETPINQVASISAPDPRTLVIEPWDKSLLKTIENGANPYFVIAYDPPGRHGKVQGHEEEV